MTNGRVAVIGLGSMGLGAAQSLLRGGFDVSGFDVASAAMERFAGLGGRAAGSPAEAAEQASAVLILVLNSAQTRDVLFGPQGAAATLAHGAVVISSATMAPEDARDLARDAQAAGLLYLDAPVSGGSTRSAAGELTVMASGSGEAFAAARPLLDAVATKVYELGNEAGIGAAYKIVNQLLAGVHIAAACEAITFAGKLGLDLRQVYEVITASAGNSWMFENRIPHVLDGDYSPKSAIDIFTKDLGIVAGIGQKQRFPLPVAATALQLFLATSAAGMGRDDDSSVARLIASITGIELPAGKEP